MPRLDRLPEASQKGLLGIPIQVNDTAPFVRLAKPLSACRIAIVTTAGLHRRGDRPFGPGDQSYRVIPSETPSVDIIQSHTSIGFDRVPIMRDINITYPLDRLRELAQRGEICTLAPRGYSFMGALRDVTKLTNEAAPDVAQRLKADGADVAILTPT